MFDITKTKAVLWDLDDTLYSRRAAARKTFPGMFRQHLYQDRSEAFIEGAADYMMTQVKRNSMIHDDAFDALLKKHPFDREYVKQDCLDYYYENMYQFAVPFQEQMEVIKALRDAGIKNAVVTNISVDRVDSQKRKFEFLGISELFDAVLFSGEIGIHKPDRRIFDLAAAKLNVANEQCIFVGDDPDSDVAGALNAGMEVVWLDHFEADGRYAGNPRVHRVKSMKEYFRF